MAPRYPQPLLAHTAVLTLLSLIALPRAATAADKSSSRPGVISVPSGPGSVAGLGESFSANLNTGSVRESVAIEVPPGTAGLAPSLALSYDSGSGNGPLGIGWSLGLSSIQVQTEKGLPRYAGKDVLLLDGAELVPLGGDLYRLKNEGRFVRVRRNGEHFELDAPDGTLFRYGLTSDARVEGVVAGVHVTFSWALERVVDRWGNEIHYLYSKDGGQVYLQEIDYNARPGAAQNRVVLEYEPRPDPLVDYRTRFGVKTGLRLARLRSYAQDALVKRYELGYDEANGNSLLASVKVVGQDGVTALPPVRFWYSRLDGPGVPVAMEGTPDSLPRPGDGDDELVDIDGDGCPDLLHAAASEHWYALNQGGRGFGPRVDMPWSPSVALSARGVEVEDFDGDGIPDLVAKLGTTNPEWHVFPNRGQGRWESDQVLARNPTFGPEDPNARVMDVDHDKLADLVRTTASGFEIWRNRGDGSWEGPYLAPLPPGGGSLRFEDSHLRLADMNGDRLLDLAYVLDGSVTYWPGKGWCEFGEPIEIEGSPKLSPPAEADLQLADVNGDGLTDLLWVNIDRVEIWPLLPGDRFGSRIQVDGVPYRDPAATAVRLADMNGNGSTDVVWSTPNARPSERLVYLDLVGEVRPNLLRAVENGLGKRVEFRYAASGAFYQAARAVGKPWAHRVPFSVQVLAESRQLDGLGREYTFEYTYRDGWYAKETREFRGFAEATATESGSEHEATVVTGYRFDLGESLEARKGLPLQVEVRDVAGELVRREVNTYQDRTYATGVDQMKVAGTDRIRFEVEHWEKSATPALTREEWSYDDYGNALVHSEWGLVVAGEVLAGNDERVTTTRWTNDADQWLLGRAVETEVADATGKRVAATRWYYDGAAFTGLPLGQVGDAGALVRKESWVEKDHWAQVERVQRDAYGLITARLDPLGARQELDYDPVSHRFPVASRRYDSDRVLSVSADYDLAQGLLLRYRDEAGRETSFTWDALHRLKSIARPGDTLAAPTQTFDYQLGSPLSSIRSMSRVLVGGAEQVEAWQWFDGMGRALGTVSQAEDGQTVIAGRREYGAKDHVLREYEPFFGTGYELRRGSTFTRRDYDELGRVPRTVLPDGSRMEARYQPLAVELWDAEDLDPASPHTKTPKTERQDGLGLSRVEERLGTTLLVTRYRRDASGNLLSVIDAAGNETQWGFDGLGRIRTVEDADSGLVRFDVDDAGHVRHRVDARGASLDVTYDAFGRPTTEQLTGADGKQEDRVVFHYDEPSALFPADLATGALTWVEDGAGQEHYRHDLRGRPVEAVRKLDGASYRWGETLDQEGRVVERSYPDGRKLAYVRNARGLLESIPGVVNGIRYDARGAFTRREHANGAVTQASYDPLHRLLTLETRAGGKAIQALGYEYDGVGNLKVITDGLRARGPLSAGRRSRYDDLYRLSEVASGDQSWTYSFNAVGDITSKSDVGDFTLGKAHLVLAAGGKAYGYDEAGNMTQRPGASLSFDARERLSRVDLQDGTAIRYRYDYAGHRVEKTSQGPAGSHRTVYVGEVYEERDGAGWLYVAENGARLARLEQQQPAVATGRTGQEGARAGLGLVAAGLALVTMGARRRGLRTLATSALTCALVVVTVMACGDHGRSTVAIPAVHYHGDHLGSTAVLTDQAGAVAEELSYDPWGKELVEAREPHAYTGKEYEADTGLYDYAARAYDPVLARFVSADPIAEVQYDGRVLEPGTGLHDYEARMNWPAIGRFIPADSHPGEIGNPASLNRYSYVLNSPYKYTDPNGHDAIPVVFPDYKIATPAGKVGGLGHAGIVLINAKSGATRYYEYGRYDSEGKGLVKRQAVPDVVMGKDGRPTADSMKRLLSAVSRKAGHGGRVEGAYVQSDSFDKMAGYAEGRMAENSNPKREPYGITDNNCGTFMKQTLEAGGVDTPWMIDRRPNSYIKELQSDFPRVQQSGAK